MVRPATPQCRVLWYKNWMVQVTLPVPHSDQVFIVYRSESMKVKTQVAVKQIDWIWWRSFGVYMVSISVQNGQDLFFYMAALKALGIVILQADGLVGGQMGTHPLPPWMIICWEILWIFSKLREDISCLNTADFSWIIFMYNIAFIFKHINVKVLVCFTELLIILIKSPFCLG